MGRSSAAQRVSRRMDPSPPRRELMLPPANPRAVQISAAFHAWLQQHRPAAGTHRIHFDHGSIILDALYAPHQQRVDALTVSKRNRQADDWVRLVVPATTPTNARGERAWQRRSGSCCAPEGAAKPAAGAP